MNTLPGWAKWLVVVILLFTTLIIPLVFFEDQSNSYATELIEWSQSEPWLAGAVLISALTADVFLPVPNGVINTVAGSMFGWVLGSVVIWLGLCLGCLVGYLVGRHAGAPLAVRLVGKADLDEARGLAARIGAPTLVLTRTVPMFAEVTTLAAGITGYPFKRFLVLTSLANVGVAIVFAGIGSAASELESGLLAFVGAVALPAAAWLIYRVIKRDSDQ
ncbi:MAG: VTT domain-containing protein [Pseudomonadota bacterium]